MGYLKIFSVLSMSMILLDGDAFATTSSQILVMSNQLYQIAKDLTTGLFPTSILLIAIGRGGVSTVHANSAQSGLLRLEQLVMEAGVPPVPEAIAEAVNVLVFIQKTSKGKMGRKVTSILQLTGYDKKDGYLTQGVG